MCKFPVFPSVEQGSNALCEQSKSEFGLSLFQDLGFRLGLYLDLGSDSGMSVAIKTFSQRTSLSN